MKGRRQLAIDNRALRARLDECEVMLAAAALQYGHDGQLIVRGEHLDAVAQASPRSALALRLMTNGSMRVDFTEPDVQITAIEEAACSST